MMKMNPLGRTGIMVPELCLGSMTWGTQNTEAEGHAQIDMALEHGVNFVDTAEMYPVNPISAETQGDSERILGTWVKKSGKREQIIIATKVSGNGPKHIRGGVDISGQKVRDAVEDSLKRLQTDYIDLYQLHWPNRGSYMFRQNWHYDPTGQSKEETLAHINDVLETCDDLIKTGKLRAIGLSNESAWGTAQWLRVSEDRGLPRMASIQNEYSLLCRLYDTDLAELSHNEDVGLLAFSPLATGLLTGKYQNGAIPDGSRASIGPTLGGRMQPRVNDAVQAYLDIASKYEYDPSAMALAWCRTRPFMASAIFGATKPDQLKTALQSVDLTLCDDCLKDINQAHRTHPMPY